MLEEIVYLAVGTTATGVGVCLLVRHVEGGGWFRWWWLREGEGGKKEREETGNKS